ncbi:Tex family protein [Halalkalibacillus halophilus]|uniref:Tex family protein n=1 Tax=Halalkalibacillus halophilus TaxID=392827 RepID=UPI00041887A8|nr:Tex family protein [Halalkalibacillus halophilus]
MTTETNAIIQIVAKQTQLQMPIVTTVVHMLEEGNTIPFIARYRKEQTKGLDETQIQSIKETYDYQQQLHQRKEEVIRLIEEQGKLTDDLKHDINRAEKLQRVEDLYRPYKQKRRTRATIAKEKGLEPLAIAIEQEQVTDLNKVAENYLDEEQELTDVDLVLQGASDIIAEWISDEPSFRDKIRNMTYAKGTIATEKKKKAEDEQGVFQMYYEYQEPVSKIASHRVLAVNRGEKEKVLKVTIDTPTEQILHYLQQEKIHKSSGEAREFLEQTIEDSYKRLIQPSIERDLRTTLTEQAEDHAITVFGKNLNSLLLQPPLKGKTILGVDPAYRTGCKLVVVDETGQMKEVDVIYPTAPRNDIAGSEKRISQLLEKYPIELVAVGNGTASRETEQFIAEFIQKNNLDHLAYLIVNEAGASVYSASKLAREEFPDLQVEERSAVSIARRVQDPLSELVKIDPKSIGVGQYQHDVSQKKLNDSLTFVVEKAVNQVGVNVNTASSSLLQYISGLNKTVANNIVKYREENGRFESRTQIKKVPRLGAKTYEQAIGFMRIIDGKEPLDRTSIHPESYKDTKEILKRINLKSDQIGSEEAVERLNQVTLQEVSDGLEVGELTLKDIMDDLKKPNRDPRDELPKPLLKTNVLSMEDLEQGMELQGTVRNVVDFGAFVDIGVKQDGLVHVSKLSQRFVKNPLDVVAVGDIVTVWVEEVDVKRQRVALTMVK